MAVQAPRAPGRCPVNDEPAYVFPRVGNFIEVVCPTCGTFRMTDAAQTRSLFLTMAQRIDELTRAQILAAEGATPIID